MQKTYLYILFSEPRTKDSKDLKRKLNEDHLVMWPIYHHGTIMNLSYSQLKRNTSFEVEYEPTTSSLPPSILWPVEAMWFLCVIFYQNIERFVYIMIDCVLIRSYERIYGIWRECQFLFINRSITVTEKAEKSIDGSKESVLTLHRVSVRWGEMAPAT